MPDHRWCLGKRRVCGDKISCPPRQLNGGCIEIALDSNLIIIIIIIIITPVDLPDL